MGFFKKMTELTIEPKKLGQVECLPPRRQWPDFVPSRILHWFRDRYQWPAQTKRDVWLVKSLFLRLFYQNHLTEKAIEEVPAAYFKSDASDKAAKDDDGKVWN